MNKFLDKSTENQSSITHSLEISLNEDEDEEFSKKNLDK